MSKTKTDDEASNADLAAMLRRWCKPYPAGECCMCASPPEEDCDEECRVPALMLIANRLELLSPASSPVPSSEAALKERNIERIIAAMRLELRTDGPDRERLQQWLDLLETAIEPPSVPSSEALAALLKELIAKWRESADRYAEEGDYDLMHATVWCSKDLEVALASLQEPAK